MPLPVRSLVLTGLLATGFVAAQDVPTPAAAPRAAMRLSAGELSVCQDQLGVHEVETPLLLFRMLAPGGYAVVIAPDGLDTTVTAYSGEGEIRIDGQAFQVPAGNQVRVSGTEKLDYFQRRIPDAEIAADPCGGVVPVVLTRPTVRPDDSGDQPDVDAASYPDPNLPPITLPPTQGPAGPPPVYPPVYAPPVVVQQQTIMIVDSSSETYGPSRRSGGGTQQPTTTPTPPPSGGRLSSPARSGSTPTPPSGGWSPIPPGPMRRPSDPPPASGGVPKVSGSGGSTTGQVNAPARTDPRPTPPSDPKPSSKKD